jgi:cell division protease FtsH
MSFRIGEEHVFLGKELQEPRDFSEETAHLIDEEVRRMLLEADDRAFEILSAHRDEMDRMVDALLQKEELLSEDLEAILGKRPNGAPPETGIIIGGERATVPPL